jgi:glycosyltransferase involved in cell wall biosynthesis
MIVAFESLFGGRYAGGANWLEVTLRALGTLQEPPTCLVLGEGATFPSGVASLPHVRPAPLGGDLPAPRLASRITRKLTGRPWEDSRITAIAESHDVDVWVGFAGFSGLGAHRPMVAWQPDFQWRHLPEMFAEAEIRGRERQWNYLADRAEGILVISQAVAEAALASHPRVAERLHVVPFAPNVGPAVLALNPDEVRRKFNLPERFLVVSNQFWRHKNHRLVIDALAEVVARGGTPPVIAFTGEPYDYRHPDEFSRLLQYVQASGVHAYCRFLGLLPRAEQVALLRASSGVIQPSLHEGRGAIAEEASVLGVRLLCSDLPVHRELAIPSVEYFQPDRPDELARLIEREAAPSARPDDEILREADDRLRAYGAGLRAMFSRFEAGASGFIPLPPREATV